MAIVLVVAAMASPLLINDAVALAASAATPRELAAAAAACTSVLASADLSSSVAHTCLGAVLFKQQNMSGAIFHLRQAQSLEPNDAVTHEYLGSLALHAARRLSRNSTAQ